jgi:hypothetical protein
MVKRDTHLAHVQRTPRGYVARCCCGWIGAARQTMRRAYTELDTHLTKHPVAIDPTTLSEGADR